MSLNLGEGIDRNGYDIGLVMYSVLSVAGLIGMLGWMWGVVGGIVGTLLGIAGAAIGAYNTKRVARGEEGFLRMRRRNAYDYLYTFLIIAGLVCLMASLFFIRSDMMDDGYALALFSLAFLFVGSLNAIVRVRALY